MIRKNRRQKKARKEKRPRRVCSRKSQIFRVEGEGMTLALKPAKITGATSGMDLT